MARTFSSEFLGTRRMGADADGISRGGRCIHSNKAGWGLFVAARDVLLADELDRVATPAKA